MSKHCELSKKIGRSDSLIKLAISCSISIHPPSKNVARRILVSNNVLVEELNALHWDINNLWA
jgi:hypothetical protein